jgi:exopolyphosphatase/guanosine-5'-triphosphate,3'-diphosphate pyrophosphatase
VRFAVLDLGSNSFHLLVADATPRGPIVRVSRKKEMVRLGAAVGPKGHIDDATMCRALDSVRGLMGVAGRRDVFRGVATAAVREAANGAELCAAVARIAGGPVDILDGPEEARLAYLGARSELPASAGRIAVVDVGGGSVEIAVGEGDAVHFTASLPLGVLRLRDLGDRLPDRVRKIAGQAARKVRSLEPDRVVFCSGTARALARLEGVPVPWSEGEDGDTKSWNPETDAPTLPLVTREDLRRLGEQLARADESRLLEMGVPSGRLDTIRPGAALVAELLDLLDVTSAIVSRRSLREGVIVRTLAQLGSRAA